VLNKSVDEIWNGQPVVSCWHSIDVEYKRFDRKQALLVELLAESIAGWFISLLVTRLILRLFGSCCLLCTPASQQCRIWLPFIAVKPAINLDELLFGHVLLRSCIRQLTLRAASSVSVGKGELSSAKKVRAIFQSIQWLEWPCVPVADRPNLL